MKRPSIKVALLSLMSAIMLAVVTLTGTALINLHSVDQSADEVGHYWMERLLTAREIKGEFANVRLSLTRFALVQNTQEYDAESEDFNKALQAFNAALTKYEGGVRTEKGRQLISAVEPIAAEYLAKGEDYRALIKAGKTKDAFAFLNAELKPRAATVNAKINELVEFIVNTATARVEQGSADAEKSFYITSSTAGVVILLCLFGCYFALVGVASPIQRITHSMRQLAGGDLANEIPYGGRADEVGEMAAAVEVFRQNAINNQRLEEEAAANRRASEANQQAEQQRIAREAEQLRVATSSLGENLKRLATGDLTCKINTSFSEEYEGLRADFNATVDQLSHTVSAVSLAVQNLENGTREIAAGANDLSKRTEQQAASLEETAAALDEITSNVASSSKMTDEARGVAEAANRSARQSTEVVSNAEAAMQRIEDKSQQISNIIGVIDEIAFQTNLLALNAGVEAARAGEAGKGFAVVAQEVRELAQRSAQAAKEIKELIHTSTAEVESGVRLVRDTGLSLTTIVDYIGQINQHMQSIATSSQEQSTGLSQVNVAVNDMDQTTQQNAAMVEQSTAAAAALSREAAKLRDLVAQFTLENSVSHSVRGLRQTAAAMAKPSRQSYPSTSMGEKGATAKLAAQAGGSSNSEWQEF